MQTKGFSIIIAFLVNHSNEYTLAFIACMVEYFLEWYFLGFLKNNWFFYIPGILVTLVGTVFRVLAQHHAKQSFTHEVQTTKRDVHVLITHGVYK
jgi:protein-S-isoprenylcysteine O-methyltransferase